MECRRNGIVTIEPHFYRTTHINVTSHCMGDADVRMSNDTRVSVVYSVIMLLMA